VQANAVIIHFQIAQLEWEVPHRVRAIDDCDEAALPGHSSKITNRK